MKKKINVTTIITTLICLLPIIPSLILYSDLPQQIPIHFNAQGVANSFMDKPIVCFLFPIGFALLNIILHAIVNNDPKKENSSPMIKAISFWLIPVISAICMSISLLASLDKNVPIQIIVPAILGVLICAIGNYLPKCRQNYTVGIKLPWTLHDENNWNKTHRLAGVLWTVSGLIMVVLAFIPYQIFSFGYITVGMIVIIAIVPAIYSYALYKRKA